MKIEIDNEDAKRLSRSLKYALVLATPGIAWLVLAIWFDFRPVNLIYFSGVFFGLAAGVRLGGK